MRTSPFLLLFCGLVFSSIGSACTARLPTYAAMSDEESLAILQTRSATIKQVQADCEIQLIDEKGDRVRLDGAMVLDFPDKARIRAWKFGHAVFDLTLTARREKSITELSAITTSALLHTQEHQTDNPQLTVDEDHHGEVASRNAYLFIMREDDPRSQVAGSHVAASMRKVVGLLDPAIMKRARVDSSRSTPDTLVVVIQDDSMTSDVASPEHLLAHEIVCEVNRSTLVPRLFRIRDDLEMTYERVAQVPGGIWPTRITLRSTSGTIIIQTSQDIGINPLLNPRTFIPPARAKRLP